MSHPRNLVSVILIVAAVSCSKNDTTAPPATLYEWETIASGTTADLGSIQFPDANVGFISGYSAATGSFVLKSTDGGSTWAKSPAISNRFLSALAFTSATTGFLVGDSGYVFKTTDGGSTWNSRKAGSALLWAVQFPSANIGYAAGNFSLAKTTDGGTSWNVLATDKDGVGLSFINDSVGIVVGAAIYSTGNGGVSWNTTPIPAGAFLTSVRHASASVVYVTDHAGNVMKSTNGGGSWAMYSTGVTSALRSVWTMDTSHVLVCGDNGVIRVSSNGGSTWHSETTPTSLLFDDLVFTPSGTGYIAGFGGTILRRR
ncbi:MAG: YCF48-related protein [Bacteroidota bacterium]